MLIVLLALLHTVSAGRPMPGEGEGEFQINQGDFQIHQDVSEECNWEYGIPGETNEHLPDGERRKLIVGGGEASRHEYPWHVQINTGCGGTVIDREWVLSAAHCFFDHENNKLNQVELRFGEGLESRLSVEIIVHPEWDPTTLENDIALVKVQPLPCNLEQIKPVKLLDTGFDINECTAFMQGYGLTEAPPQEETEGDASVESRVFPVRDPLHDGQHQQYLDMLYRLYPYGLRYDFDPYGFRRHLQFMEDQTRSGPPEDRQIREDAELPPVPVFHEVVSKVYSYDNEICADLGFQYSEEDASRYYANYGHHYGNGHQLGFNGHPYGYGHHGLGYVYGHGYAYRPAYFGGMDRRKLENEEVPEAKQLNKKQMCATTAGEDTCSGDSGGPLLIDMDLSTESHQYVQAGITSYGKSCGINPGVYTAVAQHKRWIRSVFPEAPFQAVRECDRNDYEEGGGEKRLINELRWRQDLIGRLSQETHELMDKLFE